MHILSISEVGREQPNPVGATGANLGALVGLGVTAPEGFCIAVTAYDEFMAASGMRERLNQFISQTSEMGLNELTEKATEFQRQFVETPLPPNLRQILVEA